MTSPLVHDKVWLDKNKYDEAERQYFEKLAKLVSNGISKPCPLDIQTSDLSKVGATSKRAGSKEAKRSVKNGGSIPLVDKKDRNSNSLLSKKEHSAQVIKANASKDVSESLFPTSNPIVPSLSEKRLKPKDVKEKRNKADKKGSETRMSVKDDAKGTPNTPQKNSLAGEVAKARQHIKNSLECMDNLTTLTGSANVELVNKINSLEKENSTIHKKLESLDSLVQKLEARIKSLEIGGKGAPAATAAKPTPVAVAKKTDDDDDDGVDLFGSDSEDESEEAKKVREARVSAYTAKKSNKPALVAKSNIILDVKPWDDETDMKKMEQEVRKVTCDGLLWGASKLVPLAYGIHKLQISCVVEDDKVSIDWLQETLELIEDFVQSVDIAAFNKV